MGIAAVALAELSSMGTVNVNGDMGIRRADVPADALGLCGLKLGDAQARVLRPAITHCGPFVGGSR